MQRWPVAPHGVLSFFVMTQKIKSQMVPGIS